VCNILNTYFINESSLLSNVLNTIQLNNFLYMWWLTQKVLESSNGGCSESSEVSERVLPKSRKQLRKIFHNDSLSKSTQPSSPAAEHAQQQVRITTLPGSRPAAAVGSTVKGEMANTASASCRTTRSLVSLDGFSKAETLSWLTDVIEYTTDTRTIEEDRAYLFFHERRRLRVGESVTSEIDQEARMKQENGVNNLSSKDPEFVQVPQVYVAVADQLPLWNDNLVFGRGMMDIIPQVSIGW
jgi:hypothetical protein